MNLEKFYTTLGSIAYVMIVPILLLLTWYLSGKPSGW